MTYIVTSRQREKSERPPEGPFVLNQASPQARGLVVWYPLGEVDKSAGRCKDYSGKNLHLTMGGGLQAQLVPQAGGYGIVNSGSTSNYFQVLSPALTDYPFTLNAWLYLRNATDYGLEMALLHIGNSAGNNYVSLIYDGANGEGKGAHRAVCDFSGGTGNVIPSTTSVDGPGTPIMLTATATGIGDSAQSVYLNAGGAGTVGGARNATSGWDRTTVGAYRDTATFIPLSGIGLHVAAWNRALSAADVSALYDPNTRWDLYYRTGRKMWSFAPVGGIQFDQSGNSGDQLASSSYTFNRTVATNSDRYLDFAVVILGAATTVTSVTDDNLGTPVAATLVGADNSAGGSLRVEFWRVVAPATGTKQVSVVLSGSIESATLWASYYNVHQTSPTESFNSHQDSSSPATDVVTPATDGCWVRWAIGVNKTSGVTSSNTARSTVNGTAGSALDSDTGGSISPASAQTGTFTYTGLPGVSITAGYAIRPVTAAALGSRTPKNTRTNPLGLFVGMGRRIDNLPN